MKYIGYYYIKNENSITRNYKNKIEDTIRNAFLFLKYIFHNTNNTRFEKRIVECVFNNIYLDISNISYFKNVIKDFHFYYEIIDLYLNNKFISFSIKNKLKEIKNILKNNQKLNA